MIESKVKKVSIPRAPKRMAPVRAKAVPVHRPTVKASERTESLPHAVRKYFTGVGRRKEAIVRVQMIPASSKPEYAVNGRPFSQYFPFPDHAATALSPLEVSGTVTRYSVRARASGGGLHGQAVAMRMALSRALVSSDPALRMQLRALGFLTRDSRAKERKKPGLKRARRAPQFSKR